MLIRTLMRLLEAANLQSPDSLSQRICGNLDMACSIKKLTQWAGSVLLAECETKNIYGKVFSGCKGTRTCNDHQNLQNLQNFILFFVFLWTDFWPDYKKSSGTMTHWFSVLHHCASSNDTLVGWDTVYSCQVFCKRQSSTMNHHVLVFMTNSQSFL